MSDRLPSAASAARLPMPGTTFTQEIFDVEKAIVSTLQETNAVAKKDKSTPADLEQIRAACLQLGTRISNIGEHVDTAVIAEYARPAMQKRIANAEQAQSMALREVVQLGDELTVRNEIQRVACDALQRDFDAETAVEHRNAQMAALRDKLNWAQQQSLDYAVGLENAADISASFFFFTHRLEDSITDRIAALQTQNDIAAQMQTLTDAHEKDVAQRQTAISQRAKTIGDKDVQARSLEQQISEIRTKSEVALQLAKLRADFDTANGELVGNKTRAIELHAQLTSHYTTEKARLAGELSKVQGEITSLEANIQREVTQLTEQRSKAQAQLDALNKDPKVTEQTQLMEKAGAAYRAAGEKLDQARERMEKAEADHESAVETFKAKLADLNAKKDAAAEALREFEAAPKADPAEIAGHKQREQDALTQETEVHKAQLLKLEGELTAAREALTTAQGQYDTAIAAKKEAFEKAQSDLSAAERNAKLHLQKRRELSDQLDGIDEQIQALKAKLAQDKDVAALRQKVAELSAREEELNAIIEAAYKPADLRILKEIREKNASAEQDKFTAAANCQATVSARTLELQAKERELSGKVDANKEKEAEIQARLAQIQSQETAKNREVETLAAAQKKLEDDKVTGVQLADAVAATLKARGEQAALKQQRILVQNELAAEQTTFSRAQGYLNTAIARLRQAIQRAEELRNQQIANRDQVIADNNTTKRKLQEQVLRTVQDKVADLPSVSEQLAKAKEEFEALTKAKKAQVREAAEKLNEESQTIESQLQALQEKDEEFEVALANARTAHDEAADALAEAQNDRIAEKTEINDILAPAVENAEAAVTLAVEQFAAHKRAVEAQIAELQRDFELASDKTAQEKRLTELRAAATTTAQAVAALELDTSADKVLLAKLAKAAEEAVAAHTALAEAVPAEKQAARDAHAKAAEALKALNAEIEVQVNQLEAQIDQFTARLESLASPMLDARVALAAAKARVTDGQAQLEATLPGQITEANTKAEALKQQYGAAFAALETAEGFLKAKVEDACKAQREQLEPLQRELTELRRVQAGEEGNLRAIKLHHILSMNALEERMAEAGERYSALEAARAKLQKHVDRLKLAHEEELADIAHQEQLAREAIEFEAQILDLRQKFHALYGKEATRDIAASANGRQERRQYADLTSDSLLSVSGEADKVASKKIRSSNLADLLGESEGSSLAVSGRRERPSSLLSSLDSLEEVSSVSDVSRRERTSLLSSLLQEDASAQSRLSLSNGSLSPLASAAAPRSPVSKPSTFVSVAPLSTPVDGADASRAARLAAQRAERELEERAESDSVLLFHLHTANQLRHLLLSRSPAVAVAVATPSMTGPSRSLPFRGLEPDETLLDPRRSKTASPVSREPVKPTERRERQSALADMLASLDGSDASETSKSRATRPSSLAAMLGDVEGETSAPAKSGQRRSNLADLLGDGETSSPKASNSRRSNMFDDVFGSDDRSADRKDDRKKRD